MWERTGDGFFTGENVIMDYVLSILTMRDILKLKHINDVFVSNTSQDVNWWTGVVWIIVMFLSALILTAPIQCYISPNLFPLRKLILS